MNTYNFNVNLKKFAKDLIETFRELGTQLLFLQVSTFDVQYGLQPGPEGGTHLIDNVHRHLGPLHLLAGLQIINTGVRKEVGLILNIALTRF